LAIPALFTSLVSATLAVTAFIGLTSDGNASNTTNAVIVLPTSEVSSAHPSAPIAGAPTGSTATSTGPVATVVLEPLVNVASPTTRLVDADGPVTDEEAERFIRAYYGAVAAGNYETSWSQLAPEFQRGKARSYDYYVGFWNDNDIEVGDIELVETSDDRVIVQVELRWNGNNSAQIDQLTLRLDEVGNLLIASQGAVGND
jgi:hypothetical protein